MGIPEVEEAFLDILYRTLNKRLKRHPQRRWYVGIRRGEGPTLRNAFAQTPYLAPTVNIETIADVGNRLVKDRTYARKSGR
jgi:hypothetical protein